MYNSDRDTYTCDFCGHEMKWDDHDKEHGDLWTCEADRCDKVFCTKCFITRHGYRKFQEMMHDSADLVVCPDCYGKP